MVFNYESEIYRAVIFAGRAAVEAAAQAAKELDDHYVLRSAEGVLGSIAVHLALGNGADFKRVITDFGMDADDHVKTLNDLMSTS